MTQDQEKRLIEAFNNIESLLGDNQVADLVEETIKLLTGKAGELEDEEMARTKGSKNKSNAATSTASPQPAPVSVAVPENREALIADWVAATNQLASLKEKEHALRQALVAQCFDGTKLEGSETVDIGYGYQLRVTKELAYNATDKNEETTKLLAALKLRGAIGEQIAVELIRWKPDVVKKPYREVLTLAHQYNDPEILAALHAAITLKPGMPKLELVPPKQDEPVIGEVVQPQQPPVLVEAPVWTGTIEDNFSAE